MDGTRGNDPKFPSWVSDAAKTAWREARQREGCLIESTKAYPSAVKNVQGAMLLQWQEHSEPSPADLFLRLLTDQVKSVWVAIKTNKTMARIGNIGPEGLAASFCIRGCWGPMFEERMTRTKRKLHRQRVTKVANELADLLDGSDLDLWLSRYIHQLEMRILLDPERLVALAAIQSNRKAKLLSDAVDGTRQWFLSRMSGVLREFVKSIDHETVPAVSLAKPNDENARRMYFIKTMTSAFHFMFGKLMRREVAALASAAFECDMTEREVRRIAPRGDLPTN